MKIGIPRAVFYYEYYPFWAGFFHRLGIKTIVSSKTNRKIMDDGLKKATDDTCLPIKILVGHLLSFKDIDGIFLPRMVSMEEKTYLCPKFLGIPESVIQHLDLSIPILTVNVNLREGKKKLLKELKKFCRHLGYPSMAEEAFNEAQKWQSTYSQLRLKGLEFEDAISYFDTLKDNAPNQNIESPSINQLIKSQKGKLANEIEKNSRNRDKIPTIALVGHPYLTYETFANLNLLNKLKEKANLKVIEDISIEKSESSLSLLRKKMFWSHGKKILGAGLSYASDSTVNGIIYLSCFGCGTDSMTQDIVSRQARNAHKPYMMITLDEHSGEAGLVTRLEAYLDMIERRERFETHISTHG